MAVGENTPRRQSAAGVRPWCEGDYEPHTSVIFSQDVDAQVCQCHAGVAFTRLSQYMDGSIATPTSSTPLLFFTLFSCMYLDSSGLSGPACGLFVILVSMVRGVTVKVNTMLHFNCQTTDHRTRMTLRDCGRWSTGCESVQMFLMFPEFQAALDQLTRVHTGRLTDLNRLLEPMQRLGCGTRLAGR